jgi:hypothetical protein
VQAFIDLCERHQVNFYKFVHKCISTTIGCLAL